MPSSFVIADGTNFKLGGRHFPVSGVNCYFLAYCSDETRRTAIATAKTMGATVIRAWAFLSVDELSPGGVAFQYFDHGRTLLNDGPDGLHRLDALIQTADELNMKLILPLVNHWEDLGGMPSYVRALGSESPDAVSDVTEFYRNPVVRSAYRRWISGILTRRNTLTGRLYAEEPSIMAWELTNEARCPGEGGRELLLDWVNDMAALVKQLDSNHLLALGDEGFFYKKSTGHLYDGTYGVDWAEILSLKNMDFGTYHFYPQDWGYSGRLNFADRWIRDHSIVAAQLQKPVILEEFGLRLDGKKVRTSADRARWYGKWMNTAHESGTAGALVWMLGQNSADTSGYVDDFVLFDAIEMPAVAKSALKTSG